MDLKETLDAGHPLTGTYNADHTLAADEINALNIAVEGVSLDIVEWAGTAARYQNIKTAITSGSTDQAKSVAGLALSILDRGENIPLALIVKLENTGTLSSADVAAYKNNINISHAQQENLGKVRHGEIERARAK